MKVFFGNVQNHLSGRHSASLSKVLYMFSTYMSTFCCKSWICAVINQSNLVSLHMASVHLVSCMHHSLSLTAHLGCLMPVPNIASIQKWEQTTNVKLSSLCISVSGCEYICGIACQTVWFPQSVGVWNAWEIFSIWSSPPVKALKKQKEKTNKKNPVMAHLRCLCLSVFFYIFFFSSCYCWKPTQLQAHLKSLLTKGDAWWCND